MQRKKIVCRDKSQHAVAQKFQPLIALLALGAVFIGIGAVIQRLGKQGTIAKTVTQFRFQFFHVLPLPSHARFPLV